MSCLATAWAGSITYRLELRSSLEVAKIRWWAGSAVRPSTRPVIRQVLTVFPFGPYSTTRLRVAPDVDAEPSGPTPFW